MEFDKLGREIPDPTPLEIPLGAKRPENLTAMVQRMIRESMSRQAAAEGNETFDEANDFELEDEDPDLALTGYEVVEMKLEELRETQAKVAELEKEVALQQAEYESAVRAEKREKKPPPVPGAAAPESSSGDSQEEGA